jgi:hypothetical protein
MPLINVQERTEKILDEQNIKTQSKGNHRVCDIFLTLFEVHYLFEVFIKKQPNQPFSQ